MRIIYGTPSGALGRTVWFLAVEDDDGIAALVVIGVPFVHDVLLLDSPCRRDREP